MATMLVKCDVGGHLNVGIILDISHANGQHMSPSPDNAIREAVGPLQPELLGSIGILIESGWAHPFYFDFHDGIGKLTIGGRPHFLHLSQTLNCTSDIGSGVEISPLGTELMGLIAATPDAAYVTALSSALASFGIRLSAG
jgi:hypothetical protein